MNANQRQWMLAVTLSFIVGASALCADAAEPAYELTNTINQLTAKTIPSSFPASDAILELTLPEFLPPPPPRNDRCGDFALLPQDCLEYSVQKFEEEQTLLPIDRHIEHFGTSLAPSCEFNHFWRPTLSPQAHAAIVRHADQCDQTIRTAFYTLFPSLPRMNETENESSLDSGRELSGHYEGLQLAGIGDCMIEPTEQPPVTPIERRLAQGLPMETPSAADGIRSPNLEPSPQSAPIVTLNWVIASVGRWR